MSEMSQGLWHKLMFFFAQFAKPFIPFAIVYFMLCNFYKRQSEANSSNAKVLYFACWLNICWRLFAHHGGGHRYFAHKSYKCKPFLATLYAVTICMGDLFHFYYWVFLHNEHHAKCDKNEDLHSPHHKGFWAVQFQFNADEGAEDLFATFKKKVGYDAPPDKTLMKKYDADLSWVNLRVNAILFFTEPFLWIIISFVIGIHFGDLLVWQCLIPRIVTRHGISATNSFAHMFGSRPYCGNGHAPFPGCLATNCWYIALLNGGEGWHNNHHAFSLSARHGLLWWEFDWVWLGLRLLASLGIVWDLIEVSEEIRLAERDPSKIQDVGSKYAVYYKKKN